MWWDNDEGLSFILQWHPDEVEIDPDEEPEDGDAVEDRLADTYHRRYVYSRWTDETL